MPNNPDAREKTRALKLTVIVEDQYRTYVGLVHEEQIVPYGRRTVQIQLTPEQNALLECRELGKASGTTVREVIRECWLETEDGDYVPS